MPPDAVRAARPCPVDLAIDRFRASLPPVPRMPLGVAVSGGVDSIVLLHALRERVEAPMLRVLHVNHGLQPRAQHWQAFVTGTAIRYGVQTAVTRLAQSPPRGRSVEEWAREARYGALEELATTTGCGMLVLGHHAGDQIETLLLNLGRGAGLDGLCAMPSADAADEHASPPRRRPLLDVGRREILAYAKRHALEWVEDPSNLDPRWRRNAIRLHVLPALGDALPGVEANAGRAIRHLQAARRIIEELATQDLAQVRRHDAGLDRRKLAALSPDRRAQVLRCWLRGLGLAAPTERRLGEMDRQLVDGSGAHGCVRHDGRLLRRHRDAVWADRLDSAIGEGHESSFVWRGEPAVSVSDWRADLVFATGEGPPAAYLRGHMIRLRQACGSDRLRMRPEAPSRSLKNLFQERQIPPGVRVLLPAIEVDGRLFGVAGIGFDRSGDRPAFAPDGVSIELRPWAWDDPRNRHLDMARQPATDAPVRGEGAADAPL